MNQQDIYTVTSSTLATVRAESSTTSNSEYYIMFSLSEVELAFSAVHKKTFGSY